jgi:hypothetical protein
MTWWSFLASFSSLEVYALYLEDLAQYIARKIQSQAEMKSAELG